MVEFFERLSWPGAFAFCFAVLVVCGSTLGVILLVMVALDARKPAEVHVVRHVVPTGGEEIKH